MQGVGELISALTMVALSDDEISRRVAAPMENEVKNSIRLMGLLVDK